MIQVPVKDRAELKQRIKAILGHGKSQAMTSDRLAHILDYDERMVRDLIRQLIAEGMPIASSTGRPAGYFIAQTRGEVEKYLRQLKARLVEDAYRRRDFKRASQAILQPEQMEMGLGEYLTIT